jgi:replicative DNA helicase
MNLVDLNAEQAVLGVALTNGQAALDVILDPQDFSQARNTLVWKAIQSLLNRNVPTNDLVIVGSELTRLGVMEAVTVQYLEQLVANAPVDYVNIAHYAQAVREMAMRRRIVINSKRSEQIAVDLSRSTTEVLDEYERMAYAVREGEVRHTDMDFLTESWMEEWGKLKEKSIPGLSWGIPHLDGITLGLQPRNIVIVAALPGSGKTWLSLNAMLSVAKQNRSSIFFSMDEGYRNQMNKLVALLTRIPTERLKVKNVSRAEVEQIKEALGKLKEMPFEIDDNATQTAESILARARTSGSALRRKFGVEPGLIVIDYVQLIKGNDAKRTRNEQLTEITGLLKETAATLNCSILMVSQLSRAVMQSTDKEPKMSDLRDSGSLEQCADIVLGLHRPDVLARPDLKPGMISTMKVIPLKNRSTGNMHPKWLAFDPFVGTMREATEVDLTQEYRGGK